MTRTYFVVACLVASFLFVPTASSAESPLWMGLDAGAHAVGFTVECFVDPSRSFDTLPAPGTHSTRPMRVFVWYPAKVTDSVQMQFGEYFEQRCATAIPAAYQELLAARDLDTAHRQFSPASAELFGRLAMMKTAAVQDAEPVPGRFPLVVHSLGRNDYQMESTVLWEYLASHGYVVAVVPQMGRDIEHSKLAFSIEDLHLQARDVSYVIGEMSERPIVDASRVAIVGHSSGGMAALLVAAENSNVDAVASLAGSEMTAEGAAILRAFGWTAKQFRIPLLGLYAAGGRNLSFDVIDTLDAAFVHRVRLGTGESPGAAAHFDFQNWPLYAELVGVEDARGAYFRSGAAGLSFYLATVRLTRAFLDATLREDESAWRIVRGESPLREIDEGLFRFD